MKHKLQFMDLDTTIRGKAADRAQGTAYAILVTMGVVPFVERHDTVGDSGIVPVTER